jgi:HD-like signal output (HDOD) protein
MQLAKTSELSGQVLKGEPVKLTFHYNSKEINRFLNSLLTKILSRSDMLYLQGAVENVLREMVVNAVKANSKRVFFKKINRNITDPSHYEEGMNSFKSFLEESISELPVELKRNGFKVELFLKKDASGYRIIVRNNAGLLPFEQERIKTRVNKAKEYTDFSDIYMDTADDQEGEGLGIPLTIFFLKNSGIGETSFSIVSDGSITQSAFTIPFKTVHAEVSDVIENRIVDEVRDLPTFPEHIIELQAMCRNEEITIGELADKISLDPSLTASVLKLSNSAGFVTTKKIETVVEAVKIIGLKNLNSILIASSARKILDERFSSFRDIWTHCNKAAFYSRLLVQRHGLNRISDMVFIAAMLHDLGKIILLSTNKELTEQIEKISASRQMRTSTVLEEVSMGISHSTIGRMIAEKWNFPEYIIEAISYHHSPLKAGETNRDIIFITYLANSLCLIEERKFDYFYLENEVLQRFSLLSEERFNEMHEEFKQLYLKQNEF